MPLSPSQILPSLLTHNDDVVIKKLHESVKKRIDAKYEKYKSAQQEKKENNDFEKYAIFIELQQILDNQNYITLERLHLFYETLTFYKNKGVFAPEDNFLKEIEEITHDSFRENYFRILVVKEGHEFHRSMSSESSDKTKDREVAFLFVEQTLKKLKVWQQGIEYRWNKTLNKPMLPKDVINMIFCLLPEDKKILETLSSQVQAAVDIYPLHSTAHQTLNNIATAVALKFNMTQPNSVISPQQALDLTQVIPQTQTPEFIELLKTINRNNAYTEHSRKHMDSLRDDILEEIKKSNNMFVSNPCGEQLKYSLLHASKEPPIDPTPDEKIMALVDAYKDFNNRNYANVSRFAEENKTFKNYMEQYLALAYVVIPLHDSKKYDPQQAEVEFLKRFKRHSSTIKGPVREKPDPTSKRNKKFIRIIKSIGKNILASLGLWDTPEKIFTHKIDETAQKKAEDKLFEPTKKPPSLKPRAGMF